MFWKVSGIPTVSPVDVILDREHYTLEELLDEDDLIQECKSLNSRLVAFLREKGQVQKLIQYIVEEAPADADEKRIYKFPFLSCEVITCEIDALFNTLLEEEDLLDQLFAFVEPDAPHGNFLAGYFCKVVICLLVRRTHELMVYLQKHQGVLKKLVDLIGITSIMEVLVRLVGADEQILMFHAEDFQWLTSTDLLDLLIEKLSPKYSPDVHANAAEALSAVARTAPSSLAQQLASPRLVSQLFQHVLEDPSGSPSSMTHALAVCATLLDPRRAANAFAAQMSRGLRAGDTFPPIVTCDPEMVVGMLQRLGELVALLEIRGDEKPMPTTYGELRPPLGIQRLKIIEFVSVLLRTNSATAKEELLNLGTIDTVIQLFFEYPFNNILHRHVENIVASALESGAVPLLERLFTGCQLLKRLIGADNLITSTSTTRTNPKKAPVQAGNAGHITRLANRIMALSGSNPDVQRYLQEEPGWAEWQRTVLNKRNAAENVNLWTCGRPASVEEPSPQSDDEEMRDDLHSLSSGMALSRSYNRYTGGMFDGEELEDGPRNRTGTEGERGAGTSEREDEDEFFDDEGQEAAISSFRLGIDADRDDDLFDPRGAGSSAGGPTAGRGPPQGFYDFDSDEEGEGEEQAESAAVAGVTAAMGGLLVPSPPAASTQSPAQHLKSPGDAWLSLGEEAPPTPLAFIASGDSSRVFGSATESPWSPERAPRGVRPPTGSPGDEVLTGAYDDDFCPRSNSLWTTTPPPLSSQTSSSPNSSGGSSPIPFPLPLGSPASSPEIDLFADAPAAFLSPPPPLPPPPAAFLSPPPPLPPPPAAGATTANSLSSMSFFGPESGATPPPAAPSEGGLTSASPTAVVSDTVPTTSPPAESQVPVVEVVGEGGGQGSVTQRGLELGGSTVGVGGSQEGGGVGGGLPGEAESVGGGGVRGAGESPGLPFAIRVGGESVAGALSPEGTKMAMQKMMVEGVVGEALVAFSKPVSPTTPSRSSPQRAGQRSPKSPREAAEFNDHNFWRNSYDMSLLEEV